MLKGTLRRASLAVLLSAITACTGSKGDQGAPGVSTGTVSGKLTWVVGSSTFPATGVAVSFLPDVGVTATSDATGAYTATLPVGVYSVVFQGNAFAKAQTDGVSVVAGNTYGLDKVLVANNPLVVTSAVSADAVGFGQTVPLAVNVSGGTAPYTYSWAALSPDMNPTAAALTGATTATPSFTTGGFAEIVAGMKVAKMAALPTRPGFVGISTTQKQYMTYNFTCTVTDAVGFTKSVTVAVSPVTLTVSAPTGPATFSTGLAQVPGVVPVGRMMIASFPGNTADLTASFTVPSGSAATLKGAATAFPYFTPDKPGSYGLNGLTVVAGTFTGASKTCGVCHTGALQASVNAKFDEWANSAHGNYFFKTGVPAGLDTTIPNATTIFAAGIDGAIGKFYSQSCLGCHTVGYDATPSAQNNGFDDLAKSLGWKFPDVSTVDYTRYATAVPGQLQQMAGIQCESCHGPLSQHQGGFATTLKPKAEFAAETCNVCHDALTHHDKGWMYQQSKHADSSLAMLEATVEGRGAFAAHCGRCHSAQGFVTWLSQQQCGNPGSIAIPDASNTQCNPATAVPATVAFLQGLGLTTAQVQPQTCQACHDPHTTTLRVEDATKLLPSGFSVTGAGSGALCMMCHNSRNGAHGDAVAVTAFTAPHAADQSDVFMGQNAYFVGASTVSGHTAVADTCVGCHVAIVPSTLTSSTTFPNHSFGTDTSICVKCHSAGTAGGAVDGAALQAAVIQSIANLDAAAGAAVVNRLAALAPGGTLSAVLFNADPAHDESTAAAVTLPAAPTKVAFYEIHGQIGVVMTLPSAISVPYPSGARTDSIVYAQLGNVRFTPSGGAVQPAFALTAASGPQTFDAKNVTLVKALWNRFLIHGKSGASAANALPPGEDEGAKASAIHNPRFSQAALSAAQTAVTGLF
ncbi:MAG TPA: hypothetical protein VFP50_04375 [Anaeromyxobacteraceae bacterium]|nr:hypothetical protein [Anaeromyxobacteraceae bacterium]